MKQQTIGKAITLSGQGLHTGTDSTITISPADANYGIKFKRTDVEKPVIIPAIADNVSRCDRSTSLMKRDTEVTTVEHLLAALYAKGIDNALIEINGPELPILDGSAKPYVDAINEVGIVTQDIDREVFDLIDPIHFKDEETGSEIIVLPNDTLEITSTIDFDSPTLGKQYATLDGLDNFETELAPCKTFVFLKDLEQLANAGLIKGGSLDNAIVIADKVMSEEALSELAKKLGKEEIKIASTGILNNTELLFDNEPARHKLLDLIGDLALVGKRLNAKIIAHKPGHSINTKVAKLIKDQYQLYKKLKGIPKYDVNKAPLKTIVEIEAMLPHRHPFLLVDKITELSSTQVVGIKNVTYDEYFFRGHFPNNPVMPGVLQIEAMAQVGGILALSSVPDPSNWDTYFVKIDKTKFKHKVIPGDTLIIKLELLGPIRRGMVNMYGIAYVGNKIVSEGELTAQIIRRNG